eukprot:8208869-Heterocapsa_arctica.AAC.1
MSQCNNGHACDERGFSSRRCPPRVLQFSQTRATKRRCWKPAMRFRMTVAGGCTFVIGENGSHGKPTTTQ